MANNTTLPVKVTFNAETGSLTITSVHSGGCRLIDTTDTKQLTAQDRQFIANLFRWADGVQRNMPTDDMRTALGIVSAQQSWKRNEGQRFCEFRYDIPDGQTALGNETRRTLRQIGFRDQLSVWIIPAHLTPNDLVVRIRNSGPKARAKCRVIRYDQSEHDAIKQLAGEQIAEMLEEDTTSINARMAAMESKLTEISLLPDSTPQEIEKAGRLRNNALRSLIKEAKDDLSGSRKVAEMYGVMGEVQDSLNKMQEAIARAEEALAEGEEEYPPLRAVGTARKSKAKV